MKTRTRSGMTLTETLLGIAVLVVLAAIVVPAFGLARIAVKPTPDMANLRQIGMAVQVYALDSDNRLPLPVDRNRPNEICAEGSTWRQRLLPYVKYKMLFAGSGKDELMGAECPVGSPLRFLGYYGVQVFWASSGKPGGDPVLSLDKFQLPASTFLIGVNRDSSPFLTPELGTCQRAALPYGTLDPRPLRTSWLLADGHAASYSRDEVYEAGCRRWFLTKPIDPDY